MQMKKMIAAFAAYLDVLIHGRERRSTIANREILHPKIAKEAAKAAAAIMGMNNIFYRFHHLSSNEKYGTMPARLRMNVLRTHGADPVDFELWSLAVSAINGCGKCVDAHEKVVREKGISEEQIAAVVRVAAVIHAIGPVLDAVAASSI